MKSMLFTHAALCALTLGCAESGHDHAAACSPIIAACHEVDPGHGPIHDCHETGHAGDDVACSAMQDTCVALCEAAANVDAGVSN